MLHLAVQEKVSFKVMEKEGEERGTNAERYFHKAPSPPPFSLVG